MELENKLNEFLADLNVFYRKLQNYHWNVQGKDFFQVHAKLEELYNEINEQIDEIAEHILILGYQPVGTMKEFIENSSIQEAGNEKIKTLNIVEELIHDLQILKQKSIQIKQEAENKCNYETSTLMDDYLTNYSKKIWMLNETLK